MTRDTPPIREARLLGEAGKRSKIITAAAEGSACAFRLLQPTGEGDPGVHPARTGRLAGYLANDLGLLVKAQHENPPASGQIPLVVLAEFLPLVKLEGLREVLVADEGVLTGAVPITWLSAFKLAPRVRWVRTLLKLRQVAMFALLDQDETELVPEVRILPMSEPGRREVETLLAYDHDGLAVTARGLFHATVKGFKLHRTPVHLATYEVAWTPEAAARFVGLPEEGGRVVVLGLGDQGLTGVLREAGFPHVRQPKLLRPSTSHRHSA